MSSHGRPREADIGAGSHDGAETERPASPPAAEIAALRDQLLRALAETENTRRQATRAASDARKYSISGFAREMLAVSDNLQRTLAAANLHPSGGDAVLVEGVRATGRMLESVFDRFGLRKVEALGHPFDPHFQEAVMEVEDASRTPGTVAAILEDGYIIHDRLVRPARVAVVARRPAP